MCGSVRLAELTPYKTTDMQTWVSFSQATHAMTECIELCKRSLKVLSIVSYFVTFVLKLYLYAPMYIYRVSGYCNFSFSPHCP